MSEMSSRTSLTSDANTSSHTLLKEQLKSSAAKNTHVNKLDYNYCK